MILPLFKHELRFCLFPTFIIAAVVILYTCVIIGMYDPELGESLALMRDAMPELFAAFGMADQGTTLLEFVVNYLYGFLLVVLPLVLVAVLASRLVVRHIERGSISYLLAQPIGRTRLMLSQAGVLAFCLVLLMVVLTAFELVAARAMFPGELAVSDLVAVNAAMFCLWLFLSGACWAGACALPNVTAARWAGVARFSSLYRCSRGWGTSSPGSPTSRLLRCSIRSEWPRGKQALSQVLPRLASRALRSSLWGPPPSRDAT